MNKKILTSIFGACLVGMVLVVISHIHVITWSFPDEFTGWAKVQFEDKNCPNTTNTHSLLKKVVVSVNKAGTGCSADPFPRGWTYDEYNYVTADGRYVAVSSRSPAITGLPLGYSLDKKTYVLFVGTEAERNKS